LREALDGSTSLRKSGTLARFSRETREMVI
jgi:hypothetical protein